MLGIASLSPLELWGAFGTTRTPPVSRRGIKDTRPLFGGTHPRPVAGEDCCYLPAATAKFSGSPRSVVLAGLVSAITRPRRMT